MSTPVVLVLGYTGTMGQRIVRLFREHLPEVRVVGASRQPVPMQDLATRVLDYTDPATYANALRGVDFLVHAAGPFHHDPTPLVQACIEQNIHYIDVAESAVFIDKVREVVNQTLRCSVAIVTGCSTVPGLVACLAQRFALRVNLARLDVMLSLGSNNPVSHGLCFSLLRPLGQRSNDGADRWFRRLSRVKHLDGRVRYYGNFPIPFDQTILINARDIPISFTTGFDRAYITFLLNIASYVLPHVSDATLRRLCRMLIVVSGLAAKLGGREGRLTLTGRDVLGNIVDTIEVKAVENGLDIPAVTTIWAVERLLSGEYKNGCVGLEQLVTADDASQRLEQMGYHVSM